MSMKPKADLKVEVDMVPLIDIISLLLMFLVMVGETAKSATAVHMKLPQASQADSEKNLHISTEGRIVVQLTPDGAKYKAVIDNNAFDLIKGGGNKTLSKYLDDQIATRTKKGNVVVDPKGGIDIPVKLRIPESAPMREVEKVVMALAQAKLTNIHYTALKDKAAK